MILTLLAGLVSTSQLQATDVFITGSTAFRANAWAACQKMFSGGSPSITQVADTAGVAGGTTDSYASGKNYVWTMSGAPASALTNISDTLTIHANFTGSVQGIKSVEQAQKLLFLDASGVDTIAHVITNTPTIAFSDVFSASTAYPVTSGFGEDKVAIQPFVMVKSSSPTVSGITTVTWQQAKALISLGSIPLSAWTGNVLDTNLVYMINRTRDSGTRRAMLGELDYKYAQSFPVNVYNTTTHSFTSYISTLSGNSGNVVGPAGNGNANYAWGPGYVGGGDLRSELAVADTQNAAIGYLSFADAKSLNANWRNNIAFNGAWPTTDGPNIPGATTNNFAPIINGQYSYWAEEVVVYPTGSMPADQQVTLGQLGTGTSPGSFLGVLDYQSHGTNGWVVGSLENEIQNNSGVLPTAIPLWQMKVNHNGIGGVIASGHY